MKKEAKEWFEKAEDDLDTAEKLLEIGKKEPTAFYTHQAAEKAMKALQIERTGEFSYTHDLIRLFNELNAPKQFQSALEDLNPAYTATRYPDIGSLEMENPGKRLKKVEALLRWIEKQ